MDRKNKQPTQRPANTSIVAAEWSGPLPPPAALAQFDQIIPGGADRILKMVEQEQDHRMAHEGQILKATVADVKRGQLLGATFGIAALAGAVYTAYIGASPFVSIALVSLPVAIIVQSFMKRGN